MEQAVKVIRVLLVDDSASVRRALDWRLGFEPDFEVVGQAGSRDEAVSLALSSNPDVIVVDLQLQGSNDFSLAGELRRALPQNALIILSAEADMNPLRSSLDGCDFTVVSKYQPPDALITAIRAAAGSFND